MVLRVLLLPFIVLTGFGFAEEKNHGMGIVLVAVGHVDKRILEELREDLSKSFNKKVFVGKEILEPDYALNKTRDQYFSTAILNSLAKQEEYSAFERVLGIVDHDLYVPELNFVFGEASHRVAVISLSRLRQEFYGLPRESSLFHRRVVTEAFHELGHTYGLGHCQNPRCVMFFSNSLMDTDRKDTEFCQGCRSQLQGEE